MRKYLSEQFKSRKYLFGFTISEMSLVISWIHAIEQNLIAGKVCGRRQLFTLWQIENREDKVGTRRTSQNPSMPPMPYSYWLGPTAKWLHRLSKHPHQLSYRNSWHKPVGKISDSDYSRFLLFDCLFVCYTVQEHEFIL